MHYFHHTIFQFFLVAVLFISTPLSIPLPRQPDLTILSVPSRYQHLYTTPRSRRPSSTVTLPHHVSTTTTTVVALNQSDGECENDFELQTVIYNGQAQDFCVGQSGLSAVSNACPDAYTFSEDTEACHLFDCYLYTQYRNFAHTDRHGTPTSEVTDDELEDSSPEPTTDGTMDSVDSNNGAVININTNITTDTVQYELVEDDDDHEIGERLSKFKQYVQQCFSSRPVDQQCQQGFVRSSQDGVHLCYNTSCGYIPLHEKQQALSASSEPDDNEVAAEPSVEPLVLIEQSASKCVLKAGCPPGTTMWKGQCFHPCPAIYEQQYEHQDRCVVKDMHVPSCPENSTLLDNHKCS